MGMGSEIIGLRAELQGLVPTLSNIITFSVPNSVNNHQGISSPGSQAGFGPVAGRQSRSRVCGVNEYHWFKADATRQRCHTHGRSHSSGIDPHGNVARSFSVALSSPFHLN
ncbi:hypothetical protein KQX54_009670 [Cotesia glomerata]|uniref:Uncharacterized protein n=1 Tax=Cotesia glomerata TaxID=32391 RepID=A0AAV7J2Q9_COTGL|nr:hypothetical protein KQX54_009670 [Cotesia glomerata]